MKFRTDFVTNSSSSSFCVSIQVTSKKGKKISLDYWPKKEDGTGTVYVVLRSELDEVVEKIKECRSLEELKELISGELDFSELVCGESPEAEYPSENYTESIFELLDNLEEEYGELVKEIKSKLVDFRKKMDKLHSTDEIKSVTVREYFTGWGEFAGDALERFLKRLLDTDDVDVNDEDALTEALDGLLDKEDISDIANGPSTFEAEVNTTIDLETGKVERTHSYSGD